MSVSRRNFLKYAGGLAAAASVPSLLFTMKANAAINANPKKLVILTLNGGNDGVNTVIPIDSAQYALYQTYRPSISIPLADILPFGANAAGMQFGLHPAMASLMPYMGNLALFPATHTGSNSNRSHFYQEDLIDAGLHTQTATEPGGYAKGWMGRYFDGKYASQPEGVIAEDLAPGHSHFYKGNTFVLSVGDPSNLALGTDASTSNNIWMDIHGRQNSAQMSGYAGAYAYQQESLFASIDRVRSVNFLRTPGVPYPTRTTAGGTVYTPKLSSDFNKAADMLAVLPELESIHIMQDGYDTHANQGGVTGSQANLLSLMSDSLAAFFADLTSMGMANDVMVVVKTEFGRTVKQNQTNGTDHGQASCWMAFGGAVRGGVHGGYAGLDNLDANDWLRPMVDYRDILSEMLGRFMGATTSNAFFPSYGGATSPLGFVI